MACTSAKPQRRATSPTLSGAGACATSPNSSTVTPPKPTSQGLLELWRNPDQLAEVRKDLDTNIPIVTEEILRLCITNQFGIRTAHRDVEVAGVRIRAGQRVMAGIYAGLREIEVGSFVPARLLPQLADAPVGQRLALQGHHHGLRRIMKAPHPGIADRQRQANAGMNVFRKTGVIGAAEWLVMAQAPAPRRHAHPPPPPPHHCW